MNPHQILLEEQSSEWPLAATNVQALDRMLVKTFDLDGQRVRVQCNPARMRSTTAVVTASAVAERPCFLCRANRPPEQRGLPFEDLEILVNPFPVLPGHFTIVGDHQPQRLAGRFGQMLRLARRMDDSVVFYNGPRCGASAPDHFHFQAGAQGHLPLLEQIGQKPDRAETVWSGSDAHLLQLKGWLQTGWLIEGTSTERLEALAERLLDGLTRREASVEVGTEGSEPMLNLLCWWADGKGHALLMPRKAHRPSCFFRQDEGQRLISPASVEMAGLLVAARPDDFDRLDEDDIRRIYSDVCLDDDLVSSISAEVAASLAEPLLEVGIVTSDELAFRFPFPYFCLQTGETVAGEHSARWKEGRIEWNGRRYDELEFRPVESESHFVLPKVVIGIGFHWERTEEQAFEGRLKLLVDGEGLVAVNRVPLEAYLTSVISSEMSAKASPSLLKAHAVISRSWLLAQVEAKGKPRNAGAGMIETDEVRIRWYDREDHLLFDVCADDHCQRYQGVTRASTPQVREAIAATRGLVLRSDGRICDARFSKCCGGMMETFEQCWEDEPKPYLQALADRRPQTPVDGLDTEEGAREWILGSPEAFCNTHDKQILEQVLNHYDQETTDFFRWSVSMDTAEISRLARERSGIDFGDILDLQPVSRGHSGRLTALKVVGSRRSVVLGKELEIRRTFSPSHLYSSAFTVEKTPKGFTLHGAGWGHGVGLCQIGAAVMGEQGYDFRDILSHYYPDTELVFHHF